MNRFFYNASIPSFLSTSAEKVWADLSLNSRLDDNVLQKDSWAHEIATLQSSLEGFVGEIFFEYSIPRLGKRADVILLIKDVVIVLEYKVGEKSYERPDLEQVWDYALDNPCPEKRIRSLRIRFDGINASKLLVFSVRAVRFAARD